MPPSENMVDSLGKAMYGEANWESMKTTPEQRQKARQRAEQIANAKSAMWGAAGLLAIIVSLCLTVALLTATARYVF